MVNGGKRLRKLREHLGLTMRDVEQASRKLAHRYRNPRLVVPPARLSVLETANVAPSIYRLYALARIYGRTVQELFTFYGLNR